MSPEIIGIIGILIMLILMLCRMWIGLAMAVVGFAGYAYLAGIGPAFAVAGTVPYKYIAYYNFAAIPLFILMGAVLYHSGIASDLFYSAYKWIGHLPGGLAIASAIVAAILGVVTDSLIAVTTLGKAAVPEMKKYHYSESLSTSSIIGGASLASLVPPSVSFILYGILTEQSIGKLFIAAIIPSVLLTFLIVLYIYTYARIRPDLAPAGPKTRFQEKVLSLKYTWAMLFIIIVIIAGIYAGIFTPTEAGGIGAFGSFIIAGACRKLSFKILKDTFLETMQTTAMVVILVMGGYIFMKFLAVSRLTFSIGSFIEHLTISPYIVFVIIVILYLILGMFTDIYASIILTMPVIFPVIVALKFDPIWFGVVIVLVIEMGMMSPPVGINVFVLSGMTKIPVNVIFRGVWPFVVILLLFITILTFFPQIVLFLTATM